MDGADTGGRTWTDWADGADSLLPPPSYGKRGEGGAKRDVCVCVCNTPLDAISFFVASVAFKNERSFGKSFP